MFKKLNDLSNNLKSESLMDPLTELVILILSAEIIDLTYLSTN